MSRRIIDENATTETTRIADLYTFHLENGLIQDGKREFELKPYDLVQVRKSPTYEAQRQVSVDGEILFPADMCSSRATNASPKCCSGLAAC